MPAPHSNDSTQYFLGIAGKQIGPLNETEVLRRIRTGSVNFETLIWHEGMPAWGPITSLPTFDAAIKALAEAPQTPVKPKSEPQKVSENAATPKKPKKEEEEANVFLGDDKSVSIVFSESESRLGDRSFIADRVVKIVGGLVAAVILVSGYFYIQAMVTQSRVDALRAKGGPSGTDSRQNQLRKAASEMMLDPQTSEQTLLALIRTNGIDAVAQEASKTLVEYYSRSRKFADAGRLMLLLKKPAEAAKYFSEDPSSKNEAEQAFFHAYQNSKDQNERTTYLLENIRLTLSQSGQAPKAIERIRLFEQEFPGIPHPYGYYLKTVDDRISDIFSRISFHFVQSLLTYMDAELPQINLMDRPLVEVKRDKTNLYKIVGNYSGEILLNKDKLPKIRFLFWLNGDRWTLVDTNLTKERKKWAEQERTKLKTVGMTGEQMIKILEDTFHSKFPNAALHEKDLSRMPTESKEKTEF